jgi:hypothetical protein
MTSRIDAIIDLLPEFRLKQLAFVTHDTVPDVYANVIILGGA